MKKNLFLIFGAALLTTAAFAQDQLPPNPQPGKCYVKCANQDEYSDVQETVEIAPAYKTIRVIPATYKTVQERVLVKEESKKIIYVPATYKTVEVEYAAKPESKVIKATPAKLGADTKTIEISPAHSGWEYKADPNCPSANKSDCMAACFKNFPAESKTISVKTLLNDAQVSEVSTPEAKATYKKQVIDKPASTREEVIPAVYATISKQVIDKPARTEEVTVPAKTQVITKKVLSKSAEPASWKELDCKMLEPNILPILYPLNSAVLTPEAKKIIDDHLLNFMQQKPGVRVELSSHTDSRGSDSYNLALSQRRAQSVVDYLVSKGISRSRLVAKGYGETRLKNKCANGVDCTEAEHQVNRRTEFRVIQ